jgi:hypothetical protein
VAFTVGAGSTDEASTVAAFMDGPVSTAVGFTVAQDLTVVPAFMGIATRVADSTVGTRGAVNSMEAEAFTAVEGSTEEAAFMVAAAGK